MSETECVVKCVKASYVGKKTVGTKVTQMLPIFTSGG